jgi:hypothetical protein
VKIEKNVIMKKLKLVFVVAIALSIGAASQATLVIETYGPFDVTFYGDGENDGYNTGALDWTAEQRADVGAAVMAWDSHITNVPGRQIQMHVFWENFGNSILGSSYSPSNGDGTTSWNYGEHVWRDGVNYTGPFTGYDTTISYDIDAAGESWNFGSGAPGTGEIDFRSVVTHEIGHSLGWTDTYDPNPVWDDWGNTWGTTKNQYGWAGYNGLSEWDKNLVDYSGNRPVNGGKGTPGNFNQTDDPVYWDGSYATSYYGSDVPIYAPKPFEPGSSLAHLDQSTFPGYLMSPYISLGDMNRTVSGLEWAMMKDMGWTVVPVPAAVLLSVLGLGVAGVKLRKFAGEPK